MRRAALISLSLILLAPSVAPAAEDGFLFRDGDRVVFFGDSITEQKLYTRHLAQFTACRYPEREVRFFNAGWGGDTAKGGRARLERDVLALKPTVVTLFFGMNDGGYRPPDDGVTATFRENLAGIVADLKAVGARVVVFSPGCVDEAMSARLAGSRYNETLTGLAKTAREVAAGAGVPYVDIHRPMRGFLDARRAAGSADSLVPDGIHPDAEGHLLIANLMLRGLGAEPYPPLGSFDVKSGRGEGFTRVFEEREDVYLRATGAVPMPFFRAAGAEETVAGCGLLDLVSPRLTVRGLDAGTWEVSFEDADPAKFTAADLARGVALPLRGLERAKAVHDLIEKREANYSTLWRAIRIGSADIPGAEEAANGLMALDAGYHVKAREAARPIEGATIRLARAPGGENLALGKKYECSDPNARGWGAGGLTDGDWTGDPRHCFATGADEKLPKHVTVDLEKAARISAVRLGVPPFGSTRTVRIAVSQKGTEWRPVGVVEFAQRLAERRMMTFSPVTARYVRLVFEDRWPEEVQFPPPFAFVTELEVYSEK
jgi:lysophospholipase L1-like esterase